MLETATEWNMLEDARAILSDVLHAFQVGSSRRHGPPLLGGDRSNLSLFFLLRGEQTVNFIADFYLRAMCTSIGSYFSASLLAINALVSQSLASCSAKQGPFSTTRMATVSRAPFDSFEMSLFFGRRSRVDRLSNCLHF